MHYNMDKFSAQLFILFHILFSGTEFQKDSYKLEACQ